jgi:hypothetical protein
VADHFMETAKKFLEDNDDLEPAFTGCSLNVH